MKGQSSLGSTPEFPRKCCARLVEPGFSPHFGRFLGSRGEVRRIGAVRRQSNAMCEQARKERRRHVPSQRRVRRLEACLHSTAIPLLKTARIVPGFFKMTEFKAELVPSSQSAGVDINYIPASTPQVHASNLLRLPSGDLLCAWFGGSQEGLSDICVSCPSKFYLSRCSVAFECLKLPALILVDSLLAPSQRSKDMDKSAEDIRR